jgi:hypothetical protein
VADTLKIHGQAAPAPGVATDLLTMGGIGGVVSTLQVCNYGSTPAKFRIWIAVAAAADDVKQRWYWDEPLAANRGFPITTGITMGAGDVLRVQSDTGQLAFNAAGVQVT